MSTRLCDSGWILSKKEFKPSAQKYKQLQQSLAQHIPGQGATRIHRIRFRH
jgi:hypothetical protein